MQLSSRMSATARAPHLRASSTRTQKQRTTHITHITHTHICHRQRAQRWVGACWRQAERRTMTACVCKAACCRLRPHRCFTVWRSYVCAARMRSSTKSMSLLSSSSSSVYIHPMTASATSSLCQAGISKQQSTNKQCVCACVCLSVSLSIPQFSLPSFFLPSSLLGLKDAPNRSEINF